MKRRDFLIASGSVAAATAMRPRLVFGQDGSSSADTIISIFLRGGQDGLNTVVPFADNNYYNLRPSLGIDPPGGGVGSALDLDGFFGLHPSAAPLLDIYQQGDLAFIHAAGSPDPSRSHFDAQDYMERGQFVLGDGNGWLGRYLDTAASTADTAFRGVSFGQTVQLAMRSPANDVIALNDLESFDVVTLPGEIGAVKAALANLYDGNAALDTQSQAAFAAIDELSLANPGQIPPAGGADYPETNFGQRLRLCAQLLKAGLPLEAAQIDLNGWDHHDGLAADLALLLDELSRGMAAFHTDLGSLMNQVTVVTMTEFGRRAYENASGGTDHGHGGVMMAMGGNVNGGQVVGDWPGLAQSDLYIGDDLEITTDWRTVLTELLIKRGLPADLEAIFPGFSGPTTAGVFG